MHFFIFFLVTILSGSQKYDLDKFKSAKRDSNNYRIWVYFEDKDHSTIKKISERAQKRRNKSEVNKRAYWYDLNVSKNYIERLKKLGFPILNQSRWLNAVTISCDLNDLKLLKSLKFVKKIEPVQLMKKKKHSEANNFNNLNRSFLYGSSQDQMEQINAINAHNMGYFGQGVRILYIDTGFNLEHEAFDSIQVISQYDFINNDNETANETEEEVQNNQDEHGSLCLSVLSGFKEGQLIGPAFKSEFLLAKTEIVDQEIQQEEDNYVAALEWGEALGADIACASLGYVDWYSYEDLDGDTAPTTRAVDIASSLGVLCVNSAGNSGNDDWYYIITPADADSVLSVGSVDSEGTLSSFSSHGPSYDGRIKPEVCAMGSSTFCIRPGTNSEYRYASGTSLSAPLVGGAAAVILSANYNWNAMEVRNAIMKTASMAETPNNNYGYGILNTVDAIQYNQELRVESSALIPILYEVKTFPNPFNPTINMIISGAKEKLVNIEIFDIRGKLIQSTYENKSLNDTFYFSWEPSIKSSGVYFIRTNINNKIQYKKVTFLK
jgi:subtilisin family serine protease